MLGKWYQVDPKAEAMGSMSPYCAMGNNPVLHTDPDGDILPAILVGAAIGLVANGIGNFVSGKSFFEGAGKAALFGAIGGALSFGIGSAANSLFGTGASIGKAAFQMGAHGLSDGAMSAVQGGSFTSGLLSGAVSSGMSSGANAVGINGWGMVGIGGLSGGVGSSIAGGSFWRGVGQGLITSGLNHAAHSGMFGEGLAVSMVTGKMRHIVGPDAVGADVGVDVAGGGGGHAHKIQVLMLRGKESGSTYTLDESGIHGGLAFGASVGLTRYYYSGLTTQLDHTAFFGRSWELTLSFGIGVAASYANSTYNNKVYSFGTSFGWSPSILPKLQGTFGLYNTTPSSWSDFIFSY